MAKPSSPGAVKPCNISPAVKKYLAMLRQFVAILRKQTCVSGKY